jgi:hypothetical protein
MCMKKHGFVTISRNMVCTTAWIVLKEDGFHGIDLYGKIQGINVSNDYTENGMI